MDQSAFRTCLVGVDFCWDMKAMLVASLAISSSVLNVYIWKLLILSDLVTFSGVKTFDENIRFVVTRLLLMQAAVLSVTTGGAAVRDIRRVLGEES